VKKIKISVRDTILKVICLYLQFQKIETLESKPNVALSCQKSNPRLINSEYIYRKVHKKSKKAGPDKGLTSL